MAIYPVFLKIPAFFYRLMLGDIMMDGLMKDFLYYFLLLIFDSSTTELVICDIHAYSMYILAY